MGTQRLEKVASRTRLRSTCWGEKEAARAERLPLEPAHAFFPISFSVLLSPLNSKGPRDLQTREAVGIGSSSQAYP